MALQAVQRLALSEALFQDAHKLLRQLGNDSSGQLGIKFNLDDEVGRLGLGGALEQSVGGNLDVH